MKIARIVLTAASAAALAAITAAAIAQTSAEPAGSTSGHALGQQPGDADGAFVSPMKFSEPDGEKLYKRVCAGCHMPGGEGVKTGAGFYPALANNPKLAAGGYPAYVVVKGLNGMPPVGRMMTDVQVAAVVNYVRTHFGNNYADAVTAEEIKAVR